MKPLKLVGLEFANTKIHQYAIYLIYNLLRQCLYCRIYTYLRFAHIIDANIDMLNMFDRPFVMYHILILNIILYIIRIQAHLVEKLAVGAQEGARQGILR